MTLLDEDASVPSASKVVVDRMSVPCLSGATVTSLTPSRASGFTIDNQERPENTCACGESFH